MVEGTYVVDGAIMNIGLASSDERSREDEWVAYRELPVERYRTNPCFPTPTPASDQLFRFAGPVGSHDRDPNSGRMCKQDTRNPDGFRRVSPMGKLVYPI